jgi:hypothetical protein
VARPGEIAQEGDGVHRGRDGHPEPGGPGRAAAQGRRGVHRPDAARGRRWGRDGGKKLRGQPQQGRPKNSKDGKKRKKKRVLPVGAALAASLADADEAQRRIAEAVRPRVLEALGKANLRQLTDEEAEGLEQLQFDLLFALAGKDPSGEGLDQALAAVAGGFSSPPLAAEMVQTASLAITNKSGGRSPPSTG